MDRPTHTRWARVAARLGVDVVALLAAIVEGSLAEDVAIQVPASAGSRLAYSVREAAEALGVSADLVRDLIRRGELRGVRVGRRVLIPSEELASWCGRRPAGDERRSA
jgi:excisionase family DNA binding protein